MERRRALAALGAWAALAATPLGASEGLHVLVVSRARVLTETRAAQALREAEVRAGATLQARVDALKAELEIEEADLARVRAVLPQDAFEARAKNFDRKVRLARRESQRQAAQLQQVFRAARERLVAQLRPILAELLQSERADIVLDAGQVLLATPQADRTEQVIAIFDARVPPLELDLPELPPLLPVPATE